MALAWLTVGNSSHVTAIGRDDQTKDVGVRFHDGAAYVYRDVSDDDWERLLEHGSKGRFVNTVLVRKYNYDRIE